MNYAAQHTTGCNDAISGRSSASDYNRTSIAWRWLAASALVCLAATSNAVARNPDHVDPDRQDPWNNCTVCHGNDLMGGFGPSCMSAFGDPSGTGIGGCHAEFAEPALPPIGHHVPGRDDPFNNCTGCHGDDLEGGTIAPVSCFQCHGDLWSGGENQPPVSDPNGSYFGTVGVAVTFDGSGSTDADGTINSYDWDFGDGNIGTGVDPQHTYDAAGFYTVTLVVTDDGGLTDSQTTTADISEQGGNQPPVIDSGKPYSGRPGEPIQFDASGTFDPDGDPLVFLWSWGETPPTFPGSGPTPTHTYEEAGIYRVILAVSDGINFPFPTDEFDVVVSDDEINLPPTADAGGPYDDGIAGQPVTFNGSGSSDPEGDPLTYDWDFGDGSTGTGMIPSHTYTAAGTYTVTLIVNDGLADSAPDTTTIVIVPPNDPPVADAGGPYSGTVGTEVQFDGSGSSDPEGDTLTYEWDFGDGASGVGEMPTHTYTAAGTYTATLTVDDGINDPVENTAAVTITNGTNPPVPGADWEIKLPLVPDAGTLNFEKFAGVLFVEAKYDGAGTVFGIGFDAQPFVIWMDSKGALFLGVDRGGDKMGIVFSFMGNTDTIWFAEPLAPAAEEEDGMGLLGGLLGMFF